MNEQLEKNNLLEQESKDLNLKLINDNNQISNMKSENERLKNNINELNKSEMALNKSLDMFKGYLNDAKIENDKNILIISKNQDVINNVNQKLKESENQVQEIKDKNSDLKDKLNIMSNQLEDEKQKIYQLSVNNKKEYMILREECSEKVDLEARSHRDTVFKLHQSELEVKALESKLYGSMEKLQSAKNEITSLLGEIKELKDNVEYLDNENKKLKNDISTINNRNNDKLTKIRNKCSKFMSNAIKKIQLLKNEI